MNIFENDVLWGALLAWAIAQVVKVPIDYWQKKRWNFSLFFSAGGMPSSHSALITGVAHGVGLHDGFDSPLFALALAIAMIVVYDATGVRRQAGKHAAVINTMIADLAAGHPLKEEQLREVLGHTPLQAVAGIGLGIVCATVIWAI